MFSKKIVRTARFMQMPASTRLLYYDLGMDADDDGFAEAFIVMRSTGASDDDLKLLVSKGFIQIVNDDLVAYICDWETNNQIRKDRYIEGNYHYLLDGKPNGNQMATQDSIGKVSKGKKSKEEIYNEELFQSFWKSYPRKVNKPAAIKAWNKIKPDEQLFLKMLSAIDRQSKTDQWTKSKGEFIPYPSSWLNGERWNDKVEVESESNDEKPKHKETLGVGSGWW